MHEDEDGFCGHVCTPAQPAHEPEKYRQCVYAALDFRRCLKAQGHDGQHEFPAPAHQSEGAEPLSDERRKQVEARTVAHVATPPSEGGQSSVVESFQAGVEEGLKYAAASETPSMRIAAAITERLRLGQSKFVNDIEFLSNWNQQAVDADENILERVRDGLAAIIEEEMERHDQS